MLLACIILNISFFFAGQICNINVGDIINNTGIINILGEGNTISQQAGK